MKPHDTQTKHPKCASSQMQPPNKSVKSVKSVVKLQPQVSNLMTPKPETPECAKSQMHAPQKSVKPVKSVVKLQPQVSNLMTSNPQHPMLGKSPCPPLRKSVIIRVNPWLKCSSTCQADRMTTAP